VLLIGALLAVLAACAPAPAPTATSGSKPPAVAPGASGAAPSAPQGPEVANSSSTAAQADGPLRTFRIVPDQSEASYEVQEKFVQLPAPTKAVGRTNTIDGEFQLQMGDSPVLQSNHFTVDLRTLTSDQARRDRFIREQWLESDRYPIAEFTATRIEQMPGRYVEGQQIPLKITGNMKIRDVTRELTFDTTAVLQGNTISGTATTFLLMRDFGFDPPSLAILSVEDGVNLTVKFTAQADSAAV
jgi:polyisoprenoid-binding protein YceI